MIGPMVLVGLLGLALGTVLVLVSRGIGDGGTGELAERLEAILPGTNCGVCGYPVCRRYASALAAGKASPNACVPGGTAVAAHIAEICGLSQTASAEQTVAVIRCKGGAREVPRVSEYNGLPDCHAALLLGNGPRACQEGCLGYASCVGACAEGAISINDNHVAVVDSEKCTGCGECLKSCPRNLIALIPRHAMIYLACSNHGTATQVSDACACGCTGCGECVQATASGAITMKYNLPALDYASTDNFVVAAYTCPPRSFVDRVKARPKANIDSKCDGCEACRASCPVHAIAGSAGKRHEIDRTRCIGCGLCLDKCHARAIALWGGLGFAGWEWTGRRQSR